MGGSTVPGSFPFTFNLRLQRLSAIKKAAYRFSGHFQVEMEELSGDQVRVILRPLSKRPGWDCSPESFPGEVLDQELREVVADETKGVRDLLLAQAFSGLALLDPTGETADYLDDPLRIVSPRTGAE